MKKGITWLLSMLMLTSCVTVKQVQHEMNQTQGNLFYELTSKPYEGLVSDTVYLDFIDYSNIDYYTTVGRKDWFAVPLLLVNFATNKYVVRLGEHSLSQLYREFLTEAMLTECNSSTGFLLVDNQKEKAVPSSCYRLRVKVQKNETTGRLTHQNVFIILPLDDWGSEGFIEGSNTRSGETGTRLSLQVCLTKGVDSLLTKTYDVKYTLPKRKANNYNLLESSQSCMDDMAECLSMATKQIVENISEELNMLIMGQSLKAAPRKKEEATTPESPLNSPSNADNRQTDNK